MWALVKEEPPPKPKPTQADRARPLLEALVEADERGWYRIALFASAHAAGQVRRSLQKAYPAWEWKTARDSEGRPAAYVRWLGRAEP